MDISREFTFRDKLYNCRTYIDSSIDPCFVFVELNDKDLIEKFGKELTIKTDFEKILPFRDRDPEFTELRAAIFATLKVHPEFIHAKLKREAHNLVDQFNQAHAVNVSSL